MNYAAKVKKASKESQAEAEAFVMKHADLLKGASKDQIRAAIGKVANALWELRIAQLRAAKVDP